MSEGRIICPICRLPVAGLPAVLDGEVCHELCFYRTLTIRLTKERDEWHAKYNALHAQTQH